MSQGPRTMHKFAVGDGCTYNVGSDRYAGTVIAVSPSGKTITVQDDIAKRTDKNGQSEMQTYEYTRNPQGGTQTARWSDKRGGFCNGHSRFGPGRREYRDPHV